MTTFTELQKEIAAINHANGWSDTPRTEIQSRLLLDSELSELFEWHRNDSNALSDHIPPHTGIAEEIADVAIRALDTCERHCIRFSQFGKYGLLTGRLFKYGISWPEDYDRETWIVLAKHIVWSEESIPTVTIRLLGWAVHAAYREGVDINEVVQAKLEFNRKRPYRHGGKSV